MEWRGSSIVKILGSCRIHPELEIRASQTSVCTPPLGTMLKCKALLLLLGGKAWESPFQTAEWPVPLVVDYPLNGKPQSSRIGVVSYTPN